MRRLFRRKPAGPTGLCCVETMRVDHAVNLIDTALREQSYLYDEDRNTDLVDLLFDLRMVLAPGTLPARRPW